MINIPNFRCAWGSAVLAISMAAASLLIGCGGGGNDEPSRPAFSDSQIKAGMGVGEVKAVMGREPDSADFRAPHWDTLTYNFDGPATTKMVFSFTSNKITRFAKYGKGYIQSAPTIESNYYNKFFAN